MLILFERCAPQPIPTEAPNQEFTRQSKQVIERLKYIKPGENAWSSTLPEHLKLNVKGARMSMIYKRLDPNKPAYTITGSGGGGTHVYHWKENRALTNRERARLQTFPDEYNFFGGKESVRRQIGMAVPVLGAEKIMNAVKKSLKKIAWDHFWPRNQKKQPGPGFNLWGGSLKPTQGPHLPPLSNFACFLRNGVETTRGW